MCHALYIASDSPLELVERNEDAPAFCVSELQDFEQNVKKQFVVPLIVYAGAFEGCSCGFVYDDDPIEDDEYERHHDNSARESVNSLAVYLREALTQGKVEMFACWEGEQGKRPKENLTIGLDYFQEKQFGLECGTHYTVTR